MKTYLKKLLLVSILGVGFASLMQADDTYIAPESIPSEAAMFIKQHFPKAKVIAAKKDQEWFSHTFDVMLNDGTDIEFAADGKWIQIEMQGTHGVPGSIIPAPIKEYLKSNFSGLGIKEIQKKSYGYKVELSNDMDLRFKKDGQLIKIDD